MASYAMFRDLKAPCKKDCERRSETCHGACEDYAKYCKSNEQLRLKRRMEGLRNSAKGTYSKG